MTLDEFIERNMEELLREWEEFARDAQPRDGDLDRRELRDWAETLLTAIAADMQLAQSSNHRQQRSRGKQPEHAPDLTEAAQAHAMDRLAQGFNIDQMISEFRAVRATVVRLWMEQRERSNGTELEQLVRFNEALDQALTESIRRYTVVLEKARDLFTGAFGHDMRTPLSSIVTTSDALLGSADELEARHLQAVVRIRNAANRMNGILQDLLDYTRTRLGGSLPVTFEETDLALVCSAIVEEVRAIHPDRNVVLECEQGLTGTFDPDRVGQMLSNLLLNAVNYGSADSPVRLRAEGTRDEIVIRVHNEGEPIPEDLQRSMFEPLVRGRRREQSIERESGKSGLGLGLYIAREIAHAHRGQISVDSTPERGTTFEVTLSRHPPSGQTSASC